MAVIIGAIAKRLIKNRRGSQPKQKNKIMKKLTQAQKDKIKAGLTRVAGAVVTQSKGAKAPASKPMPKKASPPVGGKTFKIFGKDIKQGYVYAGGTLLAGGALYLYARNK